MKHKAGFYWVKLDDDWEPARYNPNAPSCPWDILGSEVPHTDKEIDEVDWEHPIERNAK